MSRYRGLIVVAFLALLVSTLFFQHGEAQKGEKGAQSKSAQKGPPAPQGPGPYVSQAVAFGVTPPVRDLPPPVKAAISAKEKAGEPSREGADEERVKAENDRVKQSTGLESNFRLEMLPNAGRVLAPAVMPAPSLTFDGVPHTVANVLPPDTNGDVGPNHFVQSTNANNTGFTAVGVFNKTTGATITTFTMQSLFASLPAADLCRTHDDGDPIVLYDPLADRWLISQFAIDQASTSVPSRQCIAISQTPDPTGAYFAYSFAMPDGGTINDYPHFGVWPDAYYMSDNQFNDAGTVFLGAGCFAFDRTKMLAGDPTATYIYKNVFPIDPTAGGMLPTDFDGLAPPPAGLPQLFMEFRATEFGDPLDALRVYEFVPNFAVPASSTFTVRPDIPLTAFDANSPASRAVAEQPAPGVALDVIADRLMWRLAYRNLGGTTNSWVGNFTVNVSGAAGTTAATYQGGIKWFELHSAGTALPTAFDQGIHSSGPISGATGLNNWMGSIAQDNAGNLGLGFSQSSTTQNPNIQIAGRTSGSGTLNEGEALFFASGGVQTSSSSRWGDYSAMSVDPADECTFWYTQEYYSATSSAIWNTRIGKFIFPSCTLPAKGFIASNITNCATAAPISGATVTATGGFSRTTDGAGNLQSNIGAAPGSYTVAASKAGFSSASTPGVVVSNGATSTANMCLAPIAIIGSAGATLVTESCAPASGAIDPGETVTVSFCVQDTGTLNTTNLVGTLQASGGVTSPSGPQNYGVVVAGGPAVCRNFTFTASGTCGNTITASIQMQDGATNLGTVTYTFTMGSLSAPITTTYSSGNIAVPVPDNTTVEVSISVPDVGVVSDVDVKARINHTFDGDLVISVVHPDGTVVPLAQNRGGAGANYGTGANDCSGTPTVFDDSAATAISAGAAPFAGSFRPESPLSALNGKPTAGTWKLRVADTATLDTGTIGCVQLVIGRSVFLCCPFTSGTPTIIAAPPATLAAESCIPGNGAPDPNELVTMNFPLRNTGSATTTNLVATLLPGGGVNAPSGPQNYGAVPPIGGPVSRPFSFAATGACGGTITATLHLQDGATDLGNVVFNIMIGGTTMTTTTFSNAAVITIPNPPSTGASAGAPSAPFPSNITVAGVVGNVSKVTVTLTNLNHTFPDDIDVLLVGPLGQKILLMSDAGSSFDLVNNTYTFDDAAAATLADAALSASGTYKPSNFGTGDLFPAPAPAGPYTDPQLLSTFNGLNPNGTWSLYVVDDLGGDIGNMAGGWSLAITTTDPVCCVSAACAITCPANITQPNDPNQCGAVVTYPAPTTTGSCGTITCSPASGSFFPVGTTTVTCTAQAGPSCSFTVKVNDTQPPTITCPGSITKFADSGQLGATVNPGTPIALDNCPLSITGVRSDGKALNALYPIGVTLITWTATDPSGNTATCAQSIGIMVPSGQRRRP